MTVTNTISTPKFNQISYRKAGNGPVIMLIHGFPENGELWNKVVPLLENEYTLLVPDLPGTGGSSLLETEMTMEDMAESLYEILKHEGVGKVVMAGHSMGGYTTMAFAEKHSEMLAGISLVHSLASADDEEKKETRRKSIELIKKGGKDAFIKQMTGNLFSAAFKKQHPEVIERQKERGIAQSDESLIAFYTAMMNRPDRRGILSKVGIPVQFIAGKEDAIATPEKAAEQSRLANVSFVSVYKASAHMSMLEDEKALSDDLSSFAGYCFKD